MQMSCNDCEYSSEKSVNGRTFSVIELKLRYQHLTNIEVY